MDAVALAAISLSHMFVNALSMDSCDATLTDKGRNYGNHTPLPEVEQILGLSSSLQPDEVLKRLPHLSFGFYIVNQPTISVM